MLLFVTKVLVLDSYLIEKVLDVLDVFQVLLSTWTCTCTCKYEKVLVLDSSTSKSTWPQPCSVLQNLYYLSPSGAIVTSQWGHLVACGAGIALDREYQCRSLYGLENWAFITNACTNAKDFTCSKLNWNDVPRFMLPAVFY